MRYIPRTSGIFLNGYIPPRVLFEGTVYNIETRFIYPSELNDWIAVVRNSRYGDDFQVESYLRALEYERSYSLKMIITGGTIYAGSLIAGNALSEWNKSVLEENPLVWYFHEVVIGGMRASGIVTGGAFSCIGLKDLQPLVMRIVNRCNFHGR